MDKVLIIDGKEVGFKATALTPRLYRHKIGRDIVRDLNQLKHSFKKAVESRNLKEPAEDAPEDDKKAYEEAMQDAQLSAIDLEIFENVAYIMALQYNSSIPCNPEEWLEGFSVFSIYEILPDIIQLWEVNQRTTSIPKKK